MAMHNDSEELRLSYIVTISNGSIVEGGSDLDENDDDSSQKDKKVEDSS
jgi:hypothetical protein